MLTPPTIHYSEHEVPQIITQHLLPLLATYSIFTLTGTLGAGKTTLVKELLKQAGVTADVTSPTFAYVNTYTGAHGKVFHHFDLYRIETIEQFVTAGFEEYLHEANSICIIEWPGVIENLLASPLLQKRACHITLTHDTAHRNRRIMTLEP